MLTMSSAISHNTDQMPTHPLALVEENGKQKLVRYVGGLYAIFTNFYLNEKISEP